MSEPAEAVVIQLPGHAFRRDLRWTLIGAGWATAISALVFLAASIVCAIDAA
jgi:phage/plasmid primase-like uncharacterized protein